MSLIASPLGKLLGFIYGFVGNYGWSLVILTAIVRIALYPAYVHQIKTSARMTHLQPKIKEIQTRYAGDRNMMNEKLSELYKSEGYNPSGGCLPMIVQMVVLFGLFELLRHPIKYLGESSQMIFAVHESFLWIPDMSQPDKWILPILAGITTYLTYHMTQKQQASMNPNSEGMMKSMKYLFPLMIVLLARSYPAGLSIYWFFGTLIQMGFIYRMGFIKEKIEAQYE